MFLGFFFMFRKFLKASTLESFFSDALVGLYLCLNFPNFVFIKICFTVALCQLSNLLKANKNFSTSLFVPFQFTWRPRLLQPYFGLIFELLIKQIFLLRHLFLRFTYLKILIENYLFTSIAFAWSYSQCELIYQKLIRCWYQIYTTRQLQYCHYWFR